MDQRKNRIALTIFWLFQGLALAMLLVNAAVEYSGNYYLIGDHIWFQPIVFNMASNGVLAHPFLTPVGSNLDGALTWQGWLMPLMAGKLQGLLLPDGGVESANYSNAVIAAMTFYLYSFLFYKRFGAKVAVLAGPFLLGIFLYQSGRPELFCSIALLLYFGANSMGSILHRTILTSIAVALACLASPFFGLCLAVLSVASLFALDIDYVLKWSIAIGAFILALLIVIAATAIFTQLSPIDWIEGIIDHSRRIRNRSDGAFADYFLNHSTLPVFFLFFGLIGLWAWHFLTSAKPFISRLLFSALIGCLCYITISVPPLIYNLASFAPLILYYINEPTSNAASLSQRLGRANTAVISVLFLLSTISVTVQSAITFRLGHGVDPLLNALSEIPSGSTIFAERSDLALNALISVNEMSLQLVTNKNFADYIVEFQMFSVDGFTRNSSRCSEILASNFHSADEKTFGLATFFRWTDWAFLIFDTESCDLG